MRCGIQYVVPPRPGIGDSSGWVYVEADDEYDAIANAIYADVVSTNGNEYKFGEGFASDAFTLSPNSSFGASAADLNWYLNLNNQEGSTDYTGFAKIQVAPVIEGFYVYDANNSADIVSPGDPTTQTFDVIPDSDGDAAVDLNAILSDDSSAVRQDTLWTLSVDHDSEIVASGGLSSDGSDTLIDLPSGYMQYTLKYGFDLNGDGDLSNGAEIQRVVYLDMTPHAAANILAQDIYTTAGQTFSGVVATFNGDSSASTSDYDASITWGDGVITAGTIIGSDGSFSVDGTHAYSVSGTDAVQVSVWPVSQGEGDSISGGSTAYVRDASLGADWEFINGSDAVDGSTVADGSGNSNEGTLVGDALWSTGTDGVTGLSLDGNGGGVSVADSASLDPVDQITVTATVNAATWTSSSGGAATILQKGDGQYTLATDASGNLVFSVNTVEGVQSVTAPVPSTSEWHTIVASYNDGSGGGSASLEISIDGTTYGDASVVGSPIVVSTVSLEVGDGPSDTSGSTAFNGRISSAGVYDTALAPSQVVTPDAASLAATRTIAAQNVAAKMSGGFAPNSTSLGLSGGSLPTSITLSWSVPADVTRTVYYWVFYSTNPSVPYEYLLPGHYLSATPNATITPSPIALSSLRGPGISTDSALVGSDARALDDGETGQNTYYFTIVATTTAVPPSSRSRGEALEPGATPSQTFCPPQVFFFGGLYDGDGTPTSSGTEPESQTALQIAALYDADFGVQMQTLPWDAPLLPSDLPPAGFSIVIMGQSFGGAAAVSEVYALDSLRIPRVVNLLDIFDPVFPFTSPSATYNGPHGTVSFAGGVLSNPGTTIGSSTFTIPINVKAAYTWWASPFTEYRYGNDTDSFIPATGSIGSGAYDGNFHDYEFAFNSSENTNTPWLYGLSHVSQTYNQYTLFGTGGNTDYPPPAQTPLITQLGTLKWAYGPL